MPVLAQLETEGGHAAADVAVRGGLQEESPTFTGTPAHISALGRAQALSQQQQLQGAARPLHEDLGARKGLCRPQAGDAARALESEPPRVRRSAPARYSHSVPEAPQQARTSCPTLPGSWVWPLWTDARD